MKIARMICVATAFAAAGATAQEGGKTISTPAISNPAMPKTTINFATATPGGGFPLYGNALAEIINAADPTFSIEPRNTKGSNENIPLLEAGQADIATVAGEPSYEAFMGIGRPRATHLKILTAMYSSPGMFVVRADSPYKTIRDLVGQPIAFGAKGSGLPILSRYILDGIGLKQDEDFKSVYLDHAGDGPAMVLDGRVAALWGAGVGWPGFTAIATSPGGARFVAPDADEIGRIRAKHSFLKPLTVAAGTYPNQNATINSVGSWSFILVRDSLPDDVAYRLAKTLHGAEATFCKKLAQACETTAANTVAAAPEPNLIHPGVAKYFREIGVMK
ncbi:TAXI family TRAP transporter solute-binding subunit [Bradyrhizobium sp. S69]|uniref:TAXI family TRAP transporter solute-binding subunit n=1 Tax=Bradyrhizobium sp. S69 TaxID=1641856 RepID=UPI00131AB856|nr:TAXI family TRAP transporter solute-binding subunit [Bradyrhizobium sp. S69]